MKIPLFNDASWKACQAAMLAKLLEACETMRVFLNQGANPTMQTVTAKTNIPTPHSIETAAKTLVLIDKAFAVLASGSLVDLRCGPMNALQIERDKLINGAEERPESKAAYEAADRILYIIQSGGNSPFQHRNPMYDAHNDPADDEERCNGIPSSRLNPVEYRERQSDHEAEAEVPFGNNIHMASRSMSGKGPNVQQVRRAVAGEDMPAGTVVRVVKDPKDATASVGAVLVVHDDLTTDATVEDQLRAAEQRLNAAAAVVDDEAAEIKRLAKLVKGEGKCLTVNLTADEYAALLANQKKKGGRKPGRKAK